MRNRGLSGLIVAGVLLTLGFLVLQSAQDAAAQDGRDVPFDELDVIFVVDQSQSMYLLSDPTGEPCIDAEARLIYDDSGCARMCVPCPDDETPRVEGAVGDSACVPKFSEPTRQGAVQQFIDLLRIELPGDARVGVVYFGTQGNVVVPMLDVDNEQAREDAHRFLQGVRCDEHSPEEDWTNINGALEAARGELEDNGSLAGRDPVVVLISDGHPKMDGWGTDCPPAEYYDQYKQLVEGFEEADVRVFAVRIAQTDQNGEVDQCLAQDPELQPYANILQHMAARTGGAYYRVHETYDSDRRRREVSDIYHSILANLLGQPPSPPIPVPPGTTHTVQIPPGQCSRAVIWVAKESPGVEVTLQSPGGQVYAPEVRRDAYELYNLQDPEGGDWQITLRGGGGDVSLECLGGLKFGQLEPSGSHPQCREMQIVAELWDDAGNPVTDATVIGSMLLPDSRLDDIPFQSIGDGRYTSSYATTELPGDYALSLTGKRQDGSQGMAEYIIPVIDLPYVDFTEPLPVGEEPAQVIPDEQGNLTVRAGLMKACERVTDVQTIDSTEIAASLTDSFGASTDPVALRDDGQPPDEQGYDGEFGGYVQVSSQGEHVLAITMDDRLHDVQDAISFPILVGTATPTITLTPTATATVTGGPPITDIPPTVTPTAGMTTSITPAPTPATPPPLPYCQPGLPQALETWQAGTEQIVLVTLDCSGLQEDQIIELRVMLGDRELRRDELQAPAGQGGFQLQVPVIVPKEGSEGTLTVLVTHADGETREASVFVEVLPPPPVPGIPTWLIVLAIILALIVLGVIIFLVIRFIGGGGKLTGKIVYDETPASIGGLPEESLVGSKYVIVLDEFPDVGGAPQIDPLSFDQEAIDTEFGADQMDYGGMAPVESQGLHTVLTFTAQRGKVEARVEVSETNGQVYISDMPTAPGDPPHSLRDGDTIRVGGYTLRYESLMGDDAGPDYGFEEDTAWGEPTDDLYGDGSSPGAEAAGYDDAGFDDGGFGSDTQVDGDYAGGGFDDDYSW